MLATQFSSKMLSKKRKEDFCRKACLTQKQLFVTLLNKKITIKYSNIDVGNTIFFKMLTNSEEADFCRKACLTQRQVFVAYVQERTFRCF